MEDPASWTPAHWLIHDVIEEYAERDAEICGLSLVSEIHNALRNAGYLAETATACPGPES